MASSSADAGKGKGRGPVSDAVGAVCVVVKNTFLEMLELENEACDIRRLVSAPASLDSSPRKDTGASTCAGRAASADGEAVDSDPRDEEVDTIEAEAIQGIAGVSPRPSSRGALSEGASERATGQAAGAPGDGAASEAQRQIALAASSRRARRPCRAERLRYRQLVDAIQDGIRANPAGFSIEATEAAHPAWLARDVCLVAKLRDRLLTFQQQLLQG
mmetsp:Transcript_60691/g.162441  ORF Transcript_60691/g.162441 Transcript_60691/m.162441 type:complete len:217 (-) Transcript_60691:37-687(-)